ncbi:hypothetical protein POUND7_014519, partial [Theobroma cacao]
HDLINLFNSFAIIDVALNSVKSASGEAAGAYRKRFAVLCSRAENVSNFIEAESVFGPDSCLVYKHFVTLYFVLVFDSSENELAELDLIQDKKTFHKAEASHFDGFCDDLKLHSVQIHLFVEYILLYEHLLNTIKLIFMCTGTSDHCCVTQLS